MCGDAPALIKFDVNIGTHVANRLTMRLYMHGKTSGRDLYLCPDTVDFMIAHLTKMRKEFKEECKGR